MSNFQKACKIAYSYYLEKWDVKGISSIKDVGARWLFNANREGLVIFGMPSIAINKSSGDIEPFDFFHKENRRALEQARQIEIPTEYRN